MSLSDTIIEMFSAGVSEVKIGVIPPDRGEGLYVQAHQSVSTGDAGNHTNLVHQAVLKSGSDLVECFDKLKAQVDHGKNVPLTVPFKRGNHN